MLQRIKRKLDDMRTIKALAEAAERHANAAGEREPGPEHFLLAAFDLPDGLARRAFARLGAEVTIADVQLPQAQAAAQTLRGEGWNVQALACDLAEPGQIAELVAAVGERHQRLDVVIHNAAYFPLTPFTAIDAALLQRTLSVNLMAPFFLAQAALPWMRRAGGGSLLVTSSVTGPRSE